MGKWFAIALIVLGIWVGLSIYTEGADRAFGGLLAGVPGMPAESPRARMDERMTDVHRVHSERLRGAIERESGESGE